MDIKEYISSGILEAYVLGGLSQKERQEVECMSHIYEELGVELKKLQEGFEAVSLANSIPPRAELKAMIMDAIRNEPQEHDGIETKKAPIVEISKRESSNGRAWIKVAATVLVLVSAGLIYMLVSKNGELRDVNSTLAKVEAQKDSSNQELTAAEKQRQELMALNALLKDNTTEIVNMPGTESNEESSTRVFMNKNRNQIALKVDHLPEPPSGKQYQLWAIDADGPSDMGVLALTSDTDTYLIDLTVDDPVAFAITLEVEGGQPTPDLSALQVIGNTL
ncbi:MAG: anti-sigma-K factor RskA [Crocinitomicaceae bacterium]|jgi:anti-sigma-K factor RskA